MSHAWQDRAACLGEGHWFFAPDHETPKAKAVRVANAKQVCNRCPVKAECLAYAKAHDPQHGIWGGLTEDERNGVRVRAKGQRVHGTRGGAGSHRDRGEEPCALCRQAENAYMVAYNKAKKAKRKVAA